MDMEDNQMESNIEPVLEAILQKQEANAKNQEEILESILEKTDSSETNELLEAQLVETSKVKESVDKLNETLKGVKGDKGDKGDKGETGPKGEKGDKGEQGSVGKQGPKGPAGERGPKGEKGDRGPEGKEGPRGPKGEKGDKGDPGKDFPKEALTRIEQEIKKIRKDTDNNLLWVNNGAVRSIVAGNNITITGDPQNPIISSTGGGGGGTWGSITGTLSNQTDLQNALNAKQATLISGTSIKTINGNTLLGSGDLVISGSISDGDKGDITVSASGATWTIDNGVIGIAKLSATGTPSASTYLRGDNTWATISGSGDVVGPTSATDNAIVRFDSTTGKLIKNSGVTIDNTNIVSGIAQLNVDNIRIDGNTISSTDTNGNIILSPNGTGDVIMPSLHAPTSAGFSIHNNAGSDIALFGAGGGQNVTFYDGVKLNAQTASRILSTDASSNITALSTTTYPDLTELSYVKGVTSSIQTQLNSKLSGNQTISLSGAVTGSGATAITTSLGSFTLSQLNTALSDADVATGGGTATGTNTGDQTSIVGITGTKAQFDAAVTDGNFLYVGDVTQYTDEMAQDAVGTILTDSSEIDFTYNDTTPSITASLIAGSIANSKLTNSSITIAGTSTALGGSITQDTITGLSSTGLIKRTGANTLAIANAGTDYVAPSAITSSGLTMATSRLLGRTTASTGAVEEITVASPLTFTGTTLDFDESVTLGNNARVAVNKNSGATVGTRRRINFIEGSNVTLTIADDSVNEEVDVTIAASGGGITDGDKGDITVSGSGATWTIDDDVVTFAKMQNIATDRLLGRDSALTGDVEELTVSGGIEFTGTGIQRSALTGAITASAGSNTTALGSFTLSQLNTALSDADVATGGGTATGTNTGDQTITLTGDVTGSGTGSFAATIANDAVTYAKMQNASAGNVVLARAAATSGDYSEVSVGASQLLGRGSTGDIAAITLGTNLSMSGTTLNATGGGSPGGSNTQIQFNNSGAFGGDSGFTFVAADDYYKIGAGTPTVTLGSGYGSTSVKAGGNTFYQAYFGQSTSSGTLASTDIILQNDTGTSTTNYLDIGIASSNNNDGNYSISGANSGYMYNQSGALAIGTASNNELRFHTGGTTSSQRRMMIAGNASTVTIGLAGTSTGSLALTGSTSGTATITVAAAAGTPTLTLPTTTDTLVGRATTDTLTNKRITKRIQSTASAATVTPSWDNDDMVDITAQAVGLTLANPTGTPTNGQPIIIRIRDNGTTRTIGYGSQYSAVGVTLPTATTANKVIILGGQWNSNLSRIDVTAVAQEA